MQKYFSQNNNDSRPKLKINSFYVLHKGGIKHLPPQTTFWKKTELQKKKKLEKVRFLS